MSKRSIEFEDYNNSKKSKINENSDYIRCSPLLFFDDHVSNQDNENNNVITEMFSDNLSEKNIENITNGFFHTQSSEKLVDSNNDVENYEENGICQLLNKEIVNNYDSENFNKEIVNNCEMENINSEIVNNCEMENINSEIVNNCKKENINSEIVSNCDNVNEMENANSEIVKIGDDNEVKVDIIVPNLTESNEDDTITLAETLHKNEKLSTNDLMENHNDKKIVIEETSETLNNEDHIIFKDNNDSLNENKILPHESDDLSKVSLVKSNPKLESTMSGYKLGDSSTDLELSQETTTPQKDKPITKTARTPNEEKSPMKETNTPFNKRGRPRKIIEESPKNVMHDINNNETSTIKRRLSTRIESRMESQLKEEKVVHNPKKIISEESPKNVIMHDINNNETSTIKRRLSTRIESRMESQLKEEKVDNNPKKISHSKKNKMKSIDYTDPGTWPLEVPNDLKIEIISKGPPKMESGIFPKNESNRCFAPGNYFCQMPNGEKGRRFWLVYSRSQDAAYCFACRLFKPDHSSTLANVGFTNWNKLNERLINHETNAHHWNSLEQWSQLLIDNDHTKCDRVLTNEQALSMVMLLKNFLSKKSNYIYLLANELETELENYLEDSQMNPKQE